MASGNRAPSSAGGAENQQQSEESGRDEVDFVLKVPTSTLDSDACVSCNKNQKAGPLNNNNCPHINIPKQPTLDKFNIFHLRRRPKSDPGTGTIAKHAQQKSQDSIPTVPVPVPQNPADLARNKKKSRFVKSASIARIFGNNYNTKKYEQDSGALLKLQQFKRNFMNSEKFHKKDPSEQQIQTPQTQDPNRIGDGCYVNEGGMGAGGVGDPAGSKAIWSITRGLGRLLRRHSHSIDISRPDPEFKVSYLGNVLTGWAKGEGCAEKPLATLWRNYTQNSKPDVMMKLCLCPSGLKATTRQHGLTEYWSHRITYCSSPKNYPRVFCWIYRHEGRKLKHEFRCHAVICAKESIAQDISSTLKENLAKALQEFKRDKLNKQNARLSLANSVYDNPTMPRRKIMLSVGSSNYRPPLERSKSAPKLMAIEEMIGEEDEDDEIGVAVDKVVAAVSGCSAVGSKSCGQAAGEELRACCKEDSLFPSTTLGRRRCRRGHSIRRGRLRNSFKCPKAVEAKVPLKNENVVQDSPMNKSMDSLLDTIKDEGVVAEVEGKLVHRSDSSEDDFEAFLLNYNYNSKEPLSTELISYLDMKLSPKGALSMHDLSEEGVVDNEGSSRRLEDARLALSLDDLDNYESEEHDRDESEDEVFFHQDEVLEMLRNAAESANSFVAGEKRDLMSMLQEAPCGEDDTAPPSLLCVTNKISGTTDSDEGSISSGCETSSTVTTNTDESGTTNSGVVLLKTCSVLERVRSFEQLAEHQVVHEPLGEKTPLGKHLHESAIFKRSITFPAPGIKTSFLLPSTSDSHSSQLNSFSEQDPEPHSLESHHSLHPTSNSSSKPTTSPRSANAPNGPVPRHRLLKTSGGGVGGPMASAVNTQLINHLQAIDSDSDLSDESGYVEFQDHHHQRQPSIKSVTA
ncbi:uncharacterized protein LOC129754912 [Uranotaenia lowii]|uniref:uncharacterized protein LOC129754912 n=1 Tax=Uranotaenia lowii TaxID=190385 RepID=UPI00247A915F|nr:uncharacterized protein LOC129754912 [Uranotaenia lowii]XP_055607149.1 uncharacterized protein LOC129754912 [Uranotaenia lowii]XP_055607150.1 uncharacterized protein LOC129754912 [Uranotaenia lowii]XP_055607152.1 uncharacterized protein LOC129754912 [Uranotaenia lowii]